MKTPGVSVDCWNVPPVSGVTLGQAGHCTECGSSGTVAVFEFNHFLRGCGRGGICSSWELLSCLVQQWISTPSKAPFPATESSTPSKCAQICTHPQTNVRADSAARLVHGHSDVSVHTFLCRLTGVNCGSMFPSLSFYVSMFGVSQESVSTLALLEVSVDTELLYGKTVIITELLLLQPKECRLFQKA